MSIPEYRITSAPIPSSPVSFAHGKSSTSGSPPSSPLLDPDHTTTTLLETSPAEDSPSDTETQTSAAIALLGLSMTPSSPVLGSSRPPTAASASASSSSTVSPTIVPPPRLSNQSHPMQLCPSSAVSDSGSTSSTSSTRSTRMSEARKRSDSSSATEDTGPSKRTRGSHGSYGSNESRASGTSGTSGMSGTSSSAAAQRDVSLLPPKTKSDGWTDEMKRVYAEAAIALPPSGREQRRFLSDMRGRNELLGLWITLEIGTYCGRKRISSHSQTLKNHHNTDPALKRFLTTEGLSNAAAEPTSWPPRLQDLVRRAFARVPQYPQPPATGDIDLSGLPVPPVMVRVVRKDGTEVDMTLADAIENDKAEQRVKNREKKPMGGNRRVQRRGAGGKLDSPVHSRTNSSASNSRPSPLLLAQQVGPGWDSYRSRALSSSSTSGPGSGSRHHHDHHHHPHHGSPYERPLGSSPSLALGHGGGPPARLSRTHSALQPHHHHRADSGPAGYSPSGRSFELAPSSAPAAGGYLASRGPHDPSPRGTAQRSYSHSHASSPYARTDPEMSSRSRPRPESRERHAHRNSSRDRHRDRDPHHDLGADLPSPGFAPRHQPHAPRLEFILSDTKTDEPGKVQSTERTFWR